MWHKTWLKTYKHRSGWNKVTRAMIGNQMMVYYSYYYFILLFYYGACQYDVCMTNFDVYLDHEWCVLKI